MLFPFFCPDFLFLFHQPQVIITDYAFIICFKCFLKLIDEKINEYKERNGS